MAPETFVNCRIVIERSVIHPLRFAPVLSVDERWFWEADADELVCRVHPSLPDQLTYQERHIIERELARQPGAKWRGQIGAAAEAWSPGNPRFESRIKKL